MEKNGGRPKKETTGLKNKKTIDFQKEETKKKPNENVNDNENENVNENINENVSDSCVNGLQEIIDFYNNNIGLLTPYGLEILQDYLSEMDYEVIIFAMQKAVEANIRTIQYIKGTLNNWSKQGIKNVIQAKEENQRFKQQKMPLQEETEEEKIARKIKALEKI